MTTRPLKAKFNVTHSPPRSEKHGVVQVPAGVRRWEATRGMTGGALTVSMGSAGHLAWLVCIAPAGTGARGLSHIVPG